jgi:hypothetical protein
VSEIEYEMRVRARRVSVGAQQQFSFRARSSLWRIYLAFVFKNEQKEKPAGEGGRRKKRKQSI